MKFNVGFAVYCDVVEFEPFMGEDPLAYQEAFLEYFTENYHEGMYMESETFVEWLNMMCPSCHARILERKIRPGKEDPTLPLIAF